MVIETNQKFETKKQFEEEYLGTAISADIRGLIWVDVHCQKLCWSRNTEKNLGADIHHPKAL